MNRTKDDIQRIIDYCHMFAELMLNKSSEFYPFGAMINLKGELITFGFEDYETNKPKSQDVINELTKECNNYLNKQKIRAYGIACDVRVSINDIGDKSDAILIDILHKEGLHIPKYFFTYSWTENNKLMFNESFGMKRKQPLTKKSSNK